MSGCASGVGIVAGSVHDLDDKTVLETGPLASYDLHAWIDRYTGWHRRQDYGGARVCVCMIWNDRS